jgi:hypothetical protein
MLKSNGHIDIVPEVPVEIAASDIVHDMQKVVPHDELIPQGAGLPVADGHSQILGKPHRQVG